MIKSWVVFILQLYPILVLGALVGLGTLGGCSGALGSGITCTSIPGLEETLAYLEIGMIFTIPICVIATVFAVVGLIWHLQLSDISVWKTGYPYAGILALGYLAVFAKMGGIF